MTATAADYWATYHVEAPDEGFGSVEDSLDHFDWRNRIYPGYIECMPVDGGSGKVVLDYGCGPGNDLIGFGYFSKPAKLIGVDVSPAALRIAAQRCRLHGFDVDLLRIKETPARIPVPDGSIDIIHCSGVLMMISHPEAVLKEFRRVLKPDGYAQIMVYHSDSIWLHLYVAFVLQLIEQRFSGLSKAEAFARSTDGEDCPISKSWTFQEVASLAAGAGLSCTEIGVSMSTTEMKALSHRFTALEDRRVDQESRRFLYDLTFNDRGFPVHHGRVAGINLCCRLQIA